MTPDRWAQSAVERRQILDGLRQKLEQYRRWLLDEHARVSREKAGRGGKTVTVVRGLPLDAALLHPALWVSEVVYFPLETELLRTARALGCAISDGGGMAVGQALGASINDVLLSCVAGAIGAYLRDRGEDPSGKEIRSMVPFNLRPLEDAWKLGNRFGLVPLVLPIGIDHPIERLGAVRARMDALKGGYTPVLVFGLLAVAGLLVKPAQDALLNLFAKKTTAAKKTTCIPAGRAS